MMTSLSIHALVSTMLNLPPDMVITALPVESPMVVVSLAARAAVALCPVCHHPSTRIHSHYQRTLQDHAWGTVPVRLVLTSRRFRCGHSPWTRKIFTERHPLLTAPAARMTSRYRSHLRTIAFALGGEAGGRLCRAFGLSISPPTLLTIIRQTPLPPPPTACHIGIDDWAFRKRVSYGTIIVDLETRRPIDLLPDRTADTTTRWLQAHPQLQVITRDRSGEYATATRLGAPHAQVVADRWHLLSNWREVIESTLNQHHRLLKTIPTHPYNQADQIPQAPLSPPRPPRRIRPAEEERKAQTAAHRLALWETIQSRVANGEYLRDSAKSLNLKYRTVKKYATADACPHIKAYPPRDRLLAPFEGYLRERWAAGCRNGVGLYRELRERGYRGSRIGVAVFVAQLRRDDPQPVAVTQPKLTPQDGVHLLIRHKRTPEEAAMIDQIMALHSDLATLVALGDRWIRMVALRQAESFDEWMGEATTCMVKAIRQFAINLKKDEQAVRNACRLPWSNGQTEGHVNRLKVIKRQMYGRAKFDLLRQRVLYADDG